GRTFAGVLDLEVDAPLGRVELDLGDLPGRLQAKCGGEEGFDLVVHRVRGRRQCRAVGPPKVMFVEKSISTGNGIEPHWKACRSIRTCPRLGLSLRLYRLAGLVRARTRNSTHPELR